MRRFKKHILLKSINSCVIDSPQIGKFTQRNRKGLYFNLVTQGINSYLNIHAFSTSICRKTDDDDRRRRWEIGMITKMEMEEGSAIHRALSQKGEQVWDLAGRSIRRNSIAQWIGDYRTDDLAAIDHVIDNTEPSSIEHVRACIAKHQILCETLKYQDGALETNFKGKKVGTPYTGDWMEQVTNSQENVQKFSRELDGLSKKSEVLENNRQTSAQESSATDIASASSATDTANASSVTDITSRNSNIRPSSNRGSLIDDYANPNLEQPSYMDPDD